MLAAKQRFSHFHAINSASVRAKPHLLKTAFATDRPGGDRSLADPSLADPPPGCRSAAVPGMNSVAEGVLLIHRLSPAVTLSVPGGRRHEAHAEGARHIKLLLNRWILSHAKAL
jgi:hypothetical protein